MSALDKPAPTFTLIAKPRVFRYQGRWRVDVLHVDGLYVQRWHDRVTAMNSALAIARTSRWQSIPSEPSPAERGTAWGTWMHL